MIPASQTDQYNQLAFELKKMGIIQLVADDQSLSDRRLIHVDGKELLNFTSCNYVGLEADQRLKDAAIAAIQKYGVQYYTVRAYVSLQPYEELENLLEQMFGHHIVVMPTTMLGHMTILPTLIGKDDAVILDQQVHTSVQMSAAVLKANGTYIEKVRHDRIDYLENRLKKLTDNYKQVWYLADGVYSMYGNIASLKEIHTLMEKYENFCFYVDDSHGMSWTGPNGTGTVIERIPFHERMILITSMGKAYGASGSVGVFKNETWKDKVRNLGSPLIFTGPLQPSILGAAVASAKIHLSPEIGLLQSRVKSLINYFNVKAKEMGLPFLGNGDSPIFYMGLGKQELGYQLCQIMKAKGFLTCIAAFPSVPKNKTGLRVMITIHHTQEDIDNLLNMLKLEMNTLLEKRGETFESIQERFAPLISKDYLKPI